MGIAFYLCWNPTNIIDSLGKVLTPILLGPLVLLVFLCLASLPTSHDAPTGEYVHNPLAAGLLEGYMTMDSIAALAFGIIVVTSLGHTGGGIGAKVVRRTSIAAVIAGALLGASTSAWASSGMSSRTHSLTRMVPVSWPTPRSRRWGVRGRSFSV